MNALPNSVKWVLLGSLLLNAALAGFEFAHMTGRGFGRPDQRAAFMQQMRAQQQQQQNMPAAAVRAVDEAFNAEKPEMETALKDWQEARRKTVLLLRANPLDSHELDVAMAEMRNKYITAQEVYHQIIAKAATQLNPEQRVSLARVLEPNLQRFAPGGVFGPPVRQPGREGGREGRGQGRGQGVSPDAGQVQQPPGPAAQNPADPNLGISQP